MRRLTMGMAAAAALFVLSGCGDITAGGDPPSTVNLGKFTPPKDAPAPARLGEIGPGACWPGDQRPSGGTKEGYATKDGPRNAANWLRTSDGKNEAMRYDRWLNANKDYYLLTEVVPDWDTLSPVERVVTYVGKTKAIKLSAPLYVTNTTCNKIPNVEKWKVQTLPVGEWVFFIPGHEPGTEDVRPAFKAVCGNPLLPPPAAKPKPTPSGSATSTPHPKCTSCQSSTPPPGGCKTDCATPTCPPGQHGKPPVCKDDATKAPHGTTVPGDGHNEVVGPGDPKTYNPNPTTPYTTPAKPGKPAGPPAGSTPTAVTTTPTPERTGDADGDGGGF